MDQTVLSNTDIIINNFNELLIKTFDNVKTNFKDELISQIKNDVIHKLNNTNNNDEELFNKNISMDQIKKTVKNELDNPAYRLNVTSELIIPVLFDDINIMIKQGEHIINYKYQVIGPTSYSDMGIFILIVTNYGTLIVKQTYAKPVIYIGKYQLPYEILYIINECINSFLPGDHITRYGFIERHLGKHDNVMIIQVSNISTIIEKYQNDYFSKPLIGYQAQILIDENKKLKEENEHVKKLHIQIINESKSIKIIKEKLDNDMKKYNNILDLEKKWNELKKWQDKLIISSEKIKEEREKLEIKKKKLNNEKIISDTNHIDMGNNFMDFISNFKNKVKCAICFNQIERKVALIPCGHSKCCKPCLININEKKCPICRISFDNFLDIYD